MSRLLAVFLSAFSALPGLFPLTAAEAEGLESQFEQEADASSDSDYLEWLLFLEKHPLDINQASASELSALPYLSNEEATTIVAYREKAAKFERLEDLLTAAGLDPGKVNLLKRYLTLAAPSPPILHLEAVLKLKRQTPKPSGFYTPNDSSRYLGNDLSLRSGIRLSYGEACRLLLGTAKGSGENDYADAVVAGAEWQSGQNRLLLGHYVLGFAQGLAFGRLHGFSRFSGKLSPSEQSAEALRLYQGSAPGGAFLGGAGQVTLGNLSVMAFASRQALDATRDGVTGDVRTVLGEGEHRSLDEKAKKDILREEMTGVRIGYGYREKISLGATGYLSRNHPSLSPEWNERRVYDFRGSRHSVLAGDVELSFGPGRFFAEGLKAMEAAMPGSWAGP